MTTATKKAPATPVRKATPAAKKAAPVKKAATPAKVPKATNGATTHPQFDQFLSEVLANPEARSAFEDASLRSDLAAEFTAVRMVKGLSQGEVAKLAGLGQAQVSQAEAGKALPVHVLQKMARALGGKLAIRFVH